jgi:hypothetical protein
MFALFPIVCFRHSSAHLHRSLRQKQVSSLAVFYGKNLPYIDMDYIKPPYCNEAHVNTFLHSLYRFFLLRMLSSGVSGPTSNGKTAWTLPHPSRKSHPIYTYTLFRISNFAQRTSRLPEACHDVSCLTPEGAMSGDCGFLSANLYARSLFGNYRSSSVPF